MRIYIESTIPSYVVARPARDLLQAARQQLTRDWWDLKRDKHELFTGQLVLDEIGFGDIKSDESFRAECHRVSASELSWPSLAIRAPRPPNCSGF